MGQLRILDASGDTLVKWDVKDRITVDKARALFAEKRAIGYLAYVMEPVGVQRKGTMVTEFDEKAEEIILTPAMQGG